MPGLEWPTVVGWVVTLLSGLALQWIHRTADRYSDNPLGRFFLPRDPPRRPPLGVQRVALTDSQLHHINEAVMEGQRPLVEATQALHAELAAAVALLSGDHMKKLEEEHESKRYVLANGTKIHQFDTDM
ncbi:MAG: hypothetical protein Q9203_006197 [Teloschistes exilis]